MRMEELQDGMADHENRISYLENCHTPSCAPEELETYADKQHQEFKEFSSKEWDRLKQLEGRLIHLENVLMEMKVARKKRIPKYTTYSL